MSEFEFESGIVDAHAEKIAKAMKRLNTFLFVRPTEYASTILIKSGYATKSMDVHHKSSNWGPMAGFVPVDPAFSKRFDGKKPNPDALHAKGNEVHGVAQRVHLQLKPDVISALTTGVGRHPATMREIQGFHLAGSSVSRGYASPGTRFYMYPALAGQIDYSNASPQKALFCVTSDFKAWWVQWSDRDEGDLVPIYVWAYQGNPVTGDYDLWMVAPHITWWRLHTQIVGVTDEHSKSAASLYTNWLLKYLNRRCGRSDNAVFQHGAEAQNYGFTQKLDEKLAMFTPGGTYRIVSRKEMPKILADLQNRGYLVIWNKRYGEEDPHLGHQADENAARAREIRSSLERVLESKRKLKDQIARELGGQPTSGRAQDLTRLRTTKRLLQNQLEKRLGSELYDIFSFHDKLQRQMGRTASGLMALDKSEFPEELIEISESLRNAQMALQSRVVNASSGGGKSDLAKLEGWLYSDEGEATLSALLAIEAPASLPKYLYKGEGGTSRTEQEASAAFMREVFSLESEGPGEFVKPGVKTHEHTSKVSGLVKRYEAFMEGASE